MKKQKSPCIDICKFIGPNGWCLGCARTREEARKWKKLKPYDIKSYTKLFKEEWKLLTIVLNVKFLFHFKLDISINFFFLLI